MKSKGKITISRVHCGNGDYISVQITDVISGCCFIETKMSLEEFASAITGHGYVDCEFDHNPKYVGMKREVKTEEVVCDWNSDRDTSKAKSILAKHEVDGWSGRVEDMFNNHRRTKSGYNVTFIRFVKAMNEKHETKF